MCEQMKNISEFGNEFDTFMLSTTMCWELFEIRNENNVHRAQKHTHIVCFSPLNLVSQRWNYHVYFLSLLFFLSSFSPFSFSVFIHLVVELENQP